VAIPTQSWFVVFSPCWKNFASSKVLVIVLLWTWRGLSGAVTSGGTSSTVSSGKHAAEGASAYYVDTLWTFLTLELWHWQIVDERAKVTS
jgi:hypothetical protein